MFIIVGLGNPTAEYEGTRHNVGFDVIDAIADKYNISMTERKHRAFCGKGIIAGQKVLLIKPQTYMNLSGESVFELCSYYKISPQDVIVIYDDFDLKKGDVRIRKNGSAGTHNGMRNIVKMLGTQDFARIRIGFKPDNPKIELINFVLSGISAEDKPIFEKSIKRASDAAKAFAEGKDFDFIMRTYNGSVIENQ